MDDDAKRLPPVRVAIVGGGITGAVAASTLLDAARTGFAEEGQPRLVVELFDQGRRGPGGRASHPLVSPEDHSTVLPDDDTPGPAFEPRALDHGCPGFFRASEERTRRLVHARCAPRVGGRGGRASLAARPRCRLLRARVARDRTRVRRTRRHAPPTRGAWLAATPRPGTPTGSSCTRASASPRCAPMAAAAAVAAARRRRRGRSSARQGRRRSTTPRRPTRPRRSRRCLASTPCSSRTRPLRLASGTAERGPPRRVCGARPGARARAPVQHDGRLRPAAPSGVRRDHVPRRGHLVRRADAIQTGARVSGAGRRRGVDPVDARLCRRRDQRGAHAGREDGRVQAAGGWLPQHRPSAGPPRGVPAPRRAAAERGGRRRRQPAARAEIALPPRPAVGECPASVRRPPRPRPERRPAPPPAPCAACGTSRSCCRSFTTGRMQRATRLTSSRTTRAACTTRATSAPTGAPALETAALSALDAAEHISERFLRGR